MLEIVMIYAYIRDKTAAYIAKKFVFQYFR